ncbi:hypothetical protein [Marivita sp. S2033]|uniref:hypothetical protein n=1 Tax=Marivita sp. S2033 TaxID=3373187 RepID=UPI003982092A
MTAFKLTALAVLALAVFSTSEAGAQNLRAVGPPAEFPPSGFEGRQYVDSRGCVYVRAGVDDAVNWVPRVSRDRKLICGQQPTLASRTAQAQPAPVVITPQRIVPGVPDRRVQGAKFGGTKRVVEQRIVPKHVYQSQGDTLPPVPKGYKPAWEDDRLNPHRAHMTRKGYASTQQVWSNTVPRRSISGGQAIKTPRIVGRGKGLGH